MYSSKFETDRGEFSLVCSILNLMLVLDVGLILDVKCRDILENSKNIADIDEVLEISKFTVIYSSQF